MAVFEPSDPGPAPAARPPVAVVERITTAPWRMPARATCSAHQVFVDGCGRCEKAIAARTKIRTGQHRRHIIGLMR